MKSVPTFSENRLRQTFARSASAALQMLKKAAVAPATNTEKLPKPNTGAKCRHSRNSTAQQKICSASAA